MSFLIRIIVNTLAVLITSYVLPGVTVTNVVTAIVVAVVLGLLNSFIKPILIFLTIPITILTLGLFLIVINASIIMLASKMVDGFIVNGFWNAFFFSIIMAIVSNVLHAFAKDEKENQ